MGKINNSVEIIPIDGPSGLHSRQINRDLQRQRVNNKMSYMGDQFIVQRVRQYLEANVDKTYVDITEMADFLQNKYKEYTKRKRSAFRGLVKRAYSVVLRSYGNDGGHTSSDSEVEDIGDELDDEQDGTINDQILEMYNRSSQKLPPKNDENELIDISSDDSSEQPEKVVEKAVNQKKLETNGPNDHNLNASLEIKPLENLEKKQVFTSTPVAPDRAKKRKLEIPGSASLKRKKDVPLQESNVTFKDVGGMDKVLKDVCKMLLHIRHPEIYRQIGISPPRGFLLHGPPGCGKTLLANAIAGELKIPLLKVAAPELVAGVSGESEERIRDLFDKAVESAPCVLFIDEVDAITPNRQQAQKDMERRIVAQLLSCLDDLGQNENGDRVLVIGATNRPDALDPALRRAGRFDREVCLGIPDVESRIHILKVLTAKLKLSPDFDYAHVARYSPGFVGADLVSLTREAAMAAINRVFAELKTKKLQPVVPEVNLTVENGTDEVKEIVTVDESPVAATTATATVETIASPVVVAAGAEEQAVAVEEPCMAVEEPQQSVEGEVVGQGVVGQCVEGVEGVEQSVEELLSWLHGPAPLSAEQVSVLCVLPADFSRALRCVQPSAQREGFATVPGVTWDDVGSLRSVREELQLCIVAPVRHAEKFTALGLSAPGGVLLFGPPGCGKTLLAKAVANEAGINFISVRGPELLNMYVGESERAVRQCFQRARNSAPCVIFFDELDALCPKRSDSGDGGSSMRVVNQMLTEMDGVEGREGVFIMAASNRPDIVDPAVLRPGRLDKLMYVGVPSAEDRVDILQAVTKQRTKPLLAPDVDLVAIGKCEQCDGYTGADLAALVREAGIQAVRQFMLTTNDNSNQPSAPLMVTNQHFQTAITKIRPSVSEKDQKHYEKLRKLYTAVKEVPQPAEEEIMECS